jgi:hypothetical protein
VARFRAVVWVENVERVLSLAKACYLGGEVRVILPIEPEVSFVNGAVPATGVVRPAMLEEATRGCYGLDPSTAIARWKKRHAKATKCSPATVCGSRS